MISGFLKKIIAIFAIIVAVVAAWYIWHIRHARVSTITVPVGFTSEVFASDLSNPQAMVFDNKGRMLISEPERGVVSSLERIQGTIVKKTILQKINKPSGLALYVNGTTKAQYLFVADERSVTRYTYDIGTGTITDKGTNVVALPTGGDHPYRYIAIGHNYRTKPIISGRNDPGTLKPVKLYIAVGSSCNVCVEDTWKRGAILESDLEGDYTAEFAGGIRAAEGIAFHPITNELWATEQSSVGLLDEINIVKVAGPDQEFGARRYGWPFCYGNRIRDDSFNPAKIDRIDIPQDCSKTEPATIELPAHSIPRGLAFVADSRWPKEWQNNLLVAYNGKIVRLTVDTNGTIRNIDDFITGKISGALVFGPDGALYISDYSTGVIYRIAPNS